MIASSPWRLCQSGRNERKSAKGNGRADEKALERNLQAFRFKDSKRMEKHRFEHQGHLPINFNNAPRSKALESVCLFPFHFQPIMTESPKGEGLVGKV